MTHLSKRCPLTEAVKRLILIIIVLIAIPLLHIVVALGVLVRPRWFRLCLASTRRRSPM